LKISGLPNRASASSSAEMQNDTSIVFDRRHASTARHNARCAAPSPPGSASPISISK